jgi:predicted dehydrogenase
MSEKKIRFAVVGVLNLGKAHIKGIGLNPDVAELACVCDIIPELAKEVGEANGVPYYTDFYEMLKVGGFDCVILVTPDYVHREHAVAACEAGYHVLCEKPIAQTYDDCKAMVDAAKRTGVKFMTGQVCRKAPGFVKAKELVDAGEIGELFFVESEYAHDYQFMSKAWRWDPVNLRYSIIGGGCHAIDLLRWIAGDPERVMALAILNDTALECDAVEGSNTVAVGLAAVESAAKGGEPVVTNYLK